MKKIQSSSTIQSRQSAPNGRADRKIKGSTVLIGLVVGAGILVFGYVTYDIFVLDPRRHAERVRDVKAANDALGRNRDISVLELKIEYEQSSYRTRIEVLKMDLREAESRALFLDQMVVSEAESLDRFPAEKSRESLRIAKENAARERQKITDIKSRIETATTNYQTEIREMEQKLEQLKNR